MDKNNMEKQNCPQCPNHCPANALRCGRGRAWLKQREEDGSGESEELYGLMRRCGHYLHHSAGQGHGREQKQGNHEKDRLFDALNEEEKDCLKDLLKKLLDSWEQG